MIEVITDAQKWNTALSAFDFDDAYHSFDYHRITKQNGERPWLISYKEENIKIALPLLIRDIPNSEYRDATSVYGYAGPLSQNVTFGFDNTRFKKALTALLKEAKVVSVFSRLHPYLENQERCLKNMGDIPEIGVVVNINLQLSLEQQKKQFQRRLKTHINKARRNFKVRVASSSDDIAEFVKIYHQTMTRVNAGAAYFFDFSYFKDLLSSSTVGAKLLLAIHNETQEISAGVVILKNKNIIQYHLSGVKTKFLNIYPVKLLVDEIRQQSFADNAQYFNLGGGVGSKNDSLLRFKSSFSKDIWPFKVWKLVVDKDIYDALVLRNKTVRCKAAKENCSGFFPCYRCPF